MNSANWINLVTALIAGLGIGSVATAIIQHLLKIKEAAYHSQRQDLEKRYRVIILLMYAAYDFEINKTAMRVHRPDLNDRKAVLDELEAEWTNMLLFASKKTLERLKDFINNTSKENLHKTALSMRIDLGRDSIDM